jgi:hypothetical protein
MAYLDRPAPAGYFIFPDLSVRHEGKYRLGFSLYEELKEAKDLDHETPQNAEVQKSAHVSHRLEVKSIPFTVFSAKKFPGLSESTSLSKLVAEQGCRVRIRRDVRMRRRETKGTHDYDNYDEEHEYQRNRASATPDTYVKPHPGSTPQMPIHDIDRPRSVSNASQVSHMTGRRSSVDQVNQAYQQPSAQQQYSNTMNPQTPQGMYPPHMAPQWQQPTPAVNNYMQPPQPYGQQNYQNSNVNGQYNNFATPQYPSYDQQNNHIRHGSIDYPAPPPGPPPPVPTSQSVSYPSTSQSIAPFGQLDAYGRPMNAPIQPAPSHSGMQMQSQYGSGPAHSTLGPKHDPISPYQHQAPSVQASEQQSYYGTSSVAPPKFQHSLQPTGATKRTYDVTFDNSHVDQPLRQGARPPSSPLENKFAYGMDGVDEDPQTPLDDAAMSYRRADGTERRRRLPTLA